MSRVKQKSGLWGAAVLVLAKESNSGFPILECLCMTQRRPTNMV